MKIKLSWIPFIPITLLMIFVKYIEATLPSDGNFMGFNWFNLVYTAIILVPILLVLCMFFSTIDRKTSPYYKLSKNMGAAVSAFIAAVAVIFGNVLSIMNVLSTGNIDVLRFISSVFGVLAGVAILLMGTYHMSGKNCPASMSLFLMFPAIWSAISLIQCFLSYTTVSVISTDMLDLICYALVALFFLSNAMVIGNIESKSAVKNCFVFGLPMVAAVLGYCTKKGILMAVNYQAYDMLEVIKTISLFIIAVYAIFVLVELTFKAKTKEQVQVVDRMEEIDEYIQSTIREDVEFLYQEDPEEDFIETSKKSKKNKDFLLERPVTEAEKEQNKDYLVESEPEEIAEEPKPQEKPEPVTVATPAPEPIKREKTINQSSFVAAPVSKPKEEPVDELQSRLDKIDRLILEIQAKQEEDNN